MNIEDSIAKINNTFEFDHAKAQGFDSSLEDIKEDLHRKADKTKLIDAIEQFDRFATYDDLRDLYTKTVKPVEKY
jgi:hypothetical protein